MHRDNVKRTAGEMFFFGYNVRTQPHVTYKVVDTAGNIMSSVPVTLPRGVMMHDFAITQDYAIFLDCPLVFSPDVSPALQNLTVRICVKNTPSTGHALHPQQICCKCSCTVLQQT